MLNEIDLELRARTIANFLDSARQRKGPFTSVLGVRCTRALADS